MYSRGCVFIGKKNVCHWYFRGESERVYTGIGQSLDLRMKG